eukprot:CAMPEP_0206206618 /NCGR_PEP_ID=MMETSP0166-20121206/15072_1 /ASSEMBLY_ACC=CAM_ASM_000260 /TAXON_ID=95228 /ORGANISM="Vannella robusta, Strain DIVA3 518/3/11/1/6" /LENGTH=369 /DNA_ID=CAMNT_0053627161 /DNA_START=40 /DNA_END=1146 /DNA_ORIENTATION=+
MSEEAVVVLELCSGLLRSWFVQDEVPRVYFPSMVGRPRFKAQNRASNAYVGQEAFDNRFALSINYPVQRGCVVDWSDVELLIRHAFEQLEVPSSGARVIMSEPPLNPKANRLRITQMMFDVFEVDAIHICTQGVLSMYYAGTTTGVALCSGAESTFVIPIYESIAVPHAIERIHLGGTDVTKYLVRILTERGYRFESSDDFEIARDIKEKLCTVAKDFEESMWDTMCEANYSLPDGTPITLGNETFRAPEIMFDPRFIGMQGSGIHEMLYEGIMKCSVDLRSVLYSNIFLFGGNTMFPGFEERVKQEITMLAPYGMKIGVFALPDRDLADWIGASILGSLFNNSIFTQRKFYMNNRSEWERKQYEQDNV